MSHQPVRRGARGFARWLPMLLALGAVSSMAAEPAEKARPHRLRVLFVGNSYTYTNDLPEVVARVAATRGIEIVPGMLAEPNYAIEDHLAQRHYASLLDHGWDWVVLQQGPSSLPENRDNLRIFAGRAADLARARGIRVALLSAWPALDNAATWANAEFSYRSAAEANGLCVLPVASAWRLGRAQHPSIELYHGDRLHPSHDGTLLAALVVVRGLVERRGVARSELAVALPSSDWRAAIAHADTLDAVARQAVREQSPHCLLDKPHSIE